MISDFGSCFRVFIKSIEVSAYIYVHEHYCIVELPWDSPWTWLFSFLAVDLGYYWAHRMGHGKPLRFGPIIALRW